jgi:predicted RNA-binding Zn ribbon-like protein
MTTAEELEFQREDAVIPPDARLVRDFVNTLERQTGTERLGTPSDLAAWLQERDLLAAAIGADARDLELAVRLREGLRAVLEVHAGHDPGAPADLDDVLRELPLQVAFDEGGALALTPRGGDPVRAALAGILAAVHRADADGSWSRLKACARPSCRWAYFDASRNRSARWCTMAGCGNSVKMRTAYAARKARTRGAAPTTTD